MRFFHRAVVLAPRPSKRSADLQVGICAISSGADLKISATAARQEPAPLEEPQGRTAGPALPGWTPMAARPFALGGRLAVPSVYIAAEPGRVGQALPLLGDRVAQGGKLQAGRAPTFRSTPERRLRLCDREVATVNSSWELTGGLSSKEKPTVTEAVTVATRYLTPFLTPGRSSLPRPSPALRSGSGRNVVTDVDGDFERATHVPQRFVPLLLTLDD